MNISARRRPQHLWDLKCTRAVAQREDGWFKSKGSWFVATVVSEMKMGSSISIVVLWLKYIKVPLVLDEPWFLHVFNLNFRPESSLDPGFLDESCLNLWCIYGYEIFMETTTDLNRYHISSHLWFEWMNHACSGWSWGPSMVFPRFVVRIAPFPAGASGVPVRIRSENGSNGRPCPCFFYISTRKGMAIHGNHPHCITLYIIYTVYINIYGIWSILYVYYIMDI